MTKIIYAESKIDGMGYDQFIKRWRLHACHAMQSEDFWNPIQVYRHNDVLLDLSLFLGATPRFDGVGEICYQNLADCHASLSATSMPDIIADGDELFSRVDSIEAKIYEEICVKPGVSGEIKIFFFCNRTNGSHNINVAQITTGFKKLLSTNEQCSNAINTIELLIPEGSETVNNIEGYCDDLIIEMSFSSIENAINGYQELYNSLSEIFKISDIEDELIIPVVTRSFTLYLKPNLYSSETPCSVKEN